MLEGNEIVKENKILEEKYNDLVKEITEKSEIMEKQLEEKEKTSGSIEEEMSTKI